MSTLKGTDVPKDNNLEESDQQCILDTQDVDKTIDSKKDNENEESKNNCITETQETYFENLEGSLTSPKLDMTLSMNESQDFHLIESQNIEDSIPDDSNKSVETNNEEETEKPKEDEDLIQGTPPEQTSKQSLGLKRKTDSLEVRATKLMKLSGDDEQETNDNPATDSNVVIEETQESKNEDQPMDVEEINKEPSKTTDDDTTKEKSIEHDPVQKSRQSIEVIFDKSHLKEQKSKSIEFVEIDEEGEKIVLDSSDNNTPSKLSMEKNLANTTEYATCNDTKTSDVSYTSATSTNIDGKLINGRIVHSNPSLELNEIDSKMKNSDPDNQSSSSNKNSTLIERSIGIYVKLKCLVHIDEINKESTMKEVVSVNCESINEIPSRSKTYDTSASLADISENDHKDTSPGSINSNPQLFQIPSRHSLMSTVSSSSSASSAASLAIKLAAKENLSHFSLPRGPVKHTKKFCNDSQIDTDSYDRVCKEWKNHQLLNINVFNFVNSELEVHNVSNDNHSGHINHANHQQGLQKIRSSTPEMSTETPKTTTKKSRGSKRSLKSVESNKNRHSDGSSIKDKKTGTPKGKNADTKESKDPMIGQKVFAKWSDNKYYPGEIVSKTKSKYKILFCDKQSKLLIQDFIIPIKSNLKEGLSVYATSSVDQFGSCGIILEVLTIKDEIYYCVETDEGERLKVQLENIFLSPDQAQLFREELSNSDNQSLPSTPKHLAKVTLDNMVEGKRRSKRTQLLTPDSKMEEPSGSGTNYRVARKVDIVCDNDTKTTSDSNCSFIDDDLLLGIQTEIIGTPNEQIAKGPENRIKSKYKSKKKTEVDVNTCGPIPSEGSKLFEGMSFILTCASLETLDRYSMDSKDSNSDIDTENEDDWVQIPFIRDRLREQIQAGGGLIYEDFDLIPVDEYENVKVITNVPNLTRTYLLCLSVGIPAYNHKWIIRCCQQNKIVNPAEEELPAGWSFDKKSYIDNFQRVDKRPLNSLIVMIPKLEGDEKFFDFWNLLCGNAGAVVISIDKPEDMEGYIQGTVVITHVRCPLWAIKEANNLSIPLLSTTWIVQCLIEGQVCPHDTQERYKYNFVSKK